MGGLWAYIHETYILSMERVHCVERMVCLISFEIARVLYVMNVEWVIMIKQGDKIMGLSGETDIRKNIYDCEFGLKEDR